VEKEASLIPEVTVRTLLKTQSLTIRDIRCQGRCRHPSSEECATATELVFPYQGVFARHLGRDQAIAEPNQAMFFNASEGYRISHPAPGGDACLSLAIDDALLAELAPRSLLRETGDIAFRPHRLRIDPSAQMLVTLIRHSFREGDAQPLKAESLALALVRRILGPRHSHAPSGSIGRQRLADRVKLVLASDPWRRWTLAEIAAEVGGSPVYLTQIFQQVEGLPLYQYQLQLRLARALNLLPHYEELAFLGLDVGFSNHSHFSAAFRQLYGTSPSAFRRRLLRKGGADPSGMNGPGH
jgi:AraC family transcriptional regulator